MHHAISATSLVPLSSMTCSSASSSGVPGSEEDLPDTEGSACWIAKVGMWQGNPVERQHHVKVVGLGRHARRCENVETPAHQQ